MDNRVVFYRHNDLLYGAHLDKIETLTIPDLQDLSINDAIEFYQIKKYFDASARLPSWTDENYSLYNQKQKRLFSLALQYFNALNDQTITQEYRLVNIRYVSAFWELFELCALYNNISDHVFNDILHSDHLHPRDVFEKKNIVIRYGLVLKQFILDNPFLVSIIIDAYEQDYNDKEKVFLPAELTGEEICAYLITCIENEGTSPNALQAIYQMKPTKKIPVTDEIRLKAKRKYDKYIQKMLIEGIRINYKTTLSFSSEQTEAVLEDCSENELNVSYSTAWLLDTLDYPSILNNFLYLFKYADVLQMRCSLVSKSSYITTMEKVFLNRALSCCYPDNNMVFQSLNRLAKLQMEAYYNFLGNNGIHLEDVLSWFFTHYLQEEFGCSEMRVAMPSTGANYYEKCTALCASFDSILKQFSLYVEHKSIDFDLVAISSGAKKYDQIPSLVENKYIYGMGQEFKWLTDVMFSDQCTFSYIQRIYDQGKEYTTFLELLRNEDVYLFDYYEHEKAAFLHLAERGIISIGDDEKISLRNDIELTLLYDLYKNEVVSRYYYPEQANAIFDKWLEDGILIEGGGLFSTPEVNYFNYILNRVEYINGLDLRNKYMHGVQLVNTNEQEHKDNYFTLLIVLIMFIIKINDDFVLAEQVKLENS